MSTKIFIGCVWAVGLLLLLMVLGSRHGESSIEIWMWTAGRSRIAAGGRQTMRHQKTGDSIPDQAATSDWVPSEGRALTPSLRPYPSLRMMWVLFSAILPSPVSVPSVHRTLTDLTVSPSRRP